MVVGKLEIRCNYILVIYSELRKNKQRKEIVLKFIYILCGYLPCNVEIIIISVSISENRQTKNQRIDSFFSLPSIGSVIQWVIFRVFLIFRTEYYIEHSFSSIVPFRRTIITASIDTKALNYHHRWQNVRHDFVLNAISLNHITFSPSTISQLINSKVVWIS